MQQYVSQVLLNLVWMWQERHSLSVMSLVKLNISQSKDHDFFLSAAIFRYNRMLEKVQGPTAWNESLEGMLNQG